MRNAIAVRGTLIAALGLFSCVGELSGEDGLEPGPTGGASQVGPHRPPTAPDGGGAVRPVDAGATPPGSDAGAEPPPPDAGSLPPPPPCVPSELPGLLSQACLYSDLSTRTVDPDTLAFTPAYPLWSDGAEKRRWIRLPPGATVDTSDMDHWVLPVGARLFKEFALGGKLLETRMIERGPSGYLMGSFVWNADGTDAVWTTAGQDNVLGTAHDVPSGRDCLQCHQGEPGRVLGFSAVQLSTSGPGLTLASLRALGRLSAPPPPGTTFPAPGTAVEAAALGYLHGNCGHCHTPGGTAFQRVNMVLRLSVNERSAAQTQARLTTVGIRTQAFSRLHTFRVVAQAPATSDLFARISRRGRNQMPPLGTEQTDPAGIAAVQAWIQGLAP